MNTFKKEERLCSRRNLDLLFKEGSSFLVYPYRVTFLPTHSETDHPVKVVFNVPKRRYKRAVDRNVVKRRMREVYRLNKENSLYLPLRKSDKQCLLGLQYVGKEIYPFGLLEKKMLQVFKRLLNDFPGNEVDSKNI